MALREIVDGIFQERVFSGERVNSRAENSREGGEVCPGYLNSAFRHLPQWLP